MDFRVLVEMLDHQECRECPEHQVQRVKLEIQDHGELMEPEVHKESKEKPAQGEFLVSQDLQDHLVSEEKRAKWVTQVHEVQRVYKVQWV